MSETAKHRELALPFCEGNGIDLGCGGNPIVPWAISHDLPITDYLAYNPERPESPIQWRGDARDLPFRDGTLDFVHSSHLLEDFQDWIPVLREWDRVLKLGGFLMIAVPDRKRFRAAVYAGQGDNLGHKHESHVGELTEILDTAYHVLHDDFVSGNPAEYSILFIGRKHSAGKI